jgi:GNAT superfamily N-acetyltransferase
MQPILANILVRDGLEADITACLALEHTVETDTVWQIQAHHEEYRNEWEITLRMERLPRTIELHNPPDETRLRAAFQPDHCFIVAVNRDTQTVIGYLTMLHDRIRNIGQIEDILVTRPMRRRDVGKRLINAARQWAKEHDITRLTLHTHTKNVPAINFCQRIGFQFCGFNDRFLPNQDIAVFFSQSIR